ncbi:MAG: pyridoxal phosphate-dependent aminotransferase, partial [Coriobacteriales bacterium]
MEYTHGGDIYSNDVDIDFSANLNPLGMPQAAKDALTKDVESFEPYPDYDCRELRSALSEKLGITRDWIFCTPGSSDFMLRVCLALHPQKALVTSPCFSGYSQALSVCDSEISECILKVEDGFLVGEDFVEMIPGMDIVFLCNPNNPTGVVVPHDVLEEAIKVAGDSGAVLMLDECFLPFTHEESAIVLCEGNPHLVIVRAFTKTFSMAGLRLGYGVCSDVELLSKVSSYGPEWQVSTPAQVAGVAA